MDCFLVDENIIHEISKGSKQATICFRVLRLIVEKCHRISINNELLGKYLKIINKYHTNNAHRLVRLLKYDILINTEKFIWHERLDVRLPQEFREKLRGKKKEERDLPLIDLTLSTKCKFLTSDQKLIERYQQIGVPSEFQITFLKCRETLAFLKSYHES